MFNALSITACTNITVRELLALKESGHSVYRTSHAGNWSLYKLLMSELGLPDCIWDVTCIWRDVNNQPMHQLLDGQKIPLLEHVTEKPEGKIKCLTAYHRPNHDPTTTLAHFHVAPLKQLFGNVITTQSEVLLEYKEYLQIAFDIVQTYRPEQLGRYVLPCGCMVTLCKRNRGYEADCPHNHARITGKKLAESAIETLEELRRLVLDPIGYQPKGGVLYSFELVVASYYLWSYWKFGDKPVYELSGPDMIGYATKQDFILRVEQVLKLLGEHLPEHLMPKIIDAKIVPATLFRFGYPDNCKRAKAVMNAHEMIRQVQPLKRSFKNVAEVADLLNVSLKGGLEIIEEHGKYWNLFPDPATDAFYSQHDMLANGARMVIQEQFLDMPFQTMDALLSTLAQSEQSLKKQFFKLQH